MKLVVALCLIAVVAAAPASYSGVETYAVKNVYENLGPGYYKYDYELSDGTKAQQVGQLKNEGTKEESIAVTGSFQWIAPNGIAYTVTYTADEDGYKPEVEEGPGGLSPALIAGALG